MSNIFVAYMYCKDKNDKFEISQPTTKTKERDESVESSSVQKTVNKKVIPNEPSIYLGASRRQKDVFLISESNFSRMI